MLAPSERLLKISPDLCADFAIQSAVIRAAIQGQGSRTLITPERGAMPLFWAADGISDVESGIVTDEHLVLPIGTYRYNDELGHPKSTSPRPEDKKKIIESLTADIDWTDTRPLILDEVQHGGTITQIARIFEKMGKSREGLDRADIVAAKHNAGKVRESNVTRSFQGLASGTSRFFDVIVVPIPLIGTDKEDLLNGLEADKKVTPIKNEIRVIPNPNAQRLFRSLGSLARERDYFETQEVATTLFEGVDSPHVEKWSSRFSQLIREHNSSIRKN